MSWGKIKSAQTLNNLSYFSVVIIIHASSRVSSSQVRVWVWDPFLEHTPKWGKQLSYLHHRSGFFNCCLYIVFVRPPTNSFSVFYPNPLFTAFPFESASANQKTLPIRCWYISIFNPDVRCYTSLHFPICDTLSL